MPLPEKWRLIGITERRNRSPLIAGALSMLAATTACSPDPDTRAVQEITSGGAARALQKQLDGRRQCAFVLTSIMPIKLDAKAAGRSSVRALVDNGLLQEKPADDGQILLEPTPGAKKWFCERRALSGERSFLELCYARRQMTRVWNDGSAGGTPRLRYAFRLIDSPAWTRDPRIAAAFPFLRPALSGELKAEEWGRYRDGRWEILPPGQLLLPGVIEGFSACAGEPHGECG